MPTPTPTTSLASTGWRAFGVLSLVLLLSMAYGGYQHYLNGDLAHRYEYVTNNYKTVRDSARRAAPMPLLVRVPVPGPVVYRTAPLGPGQLAAIRQGLALDLTSQLRRELARQAPRAPRVTLLQKPLVMALTDSVRVTRRPGTNQLSLTTVKTGSFQDKWLTLSTVVRPGKNGRPDSMEVKYQLRNEYDVAAWVKRAKRHWWSLGKRRIYVSLTSRNPNAHDTGLDAIPVKKATKKP